MGPAKLNENTKILRRLPTLADDFFFGAPGTGTGGVSALSNLLALFSGIAPVTTFSDITALLAGSTPLKSFAYVTDATDDPAVAEAVGALYLRLGADPSVLGNYVLIFKEGGIGGDNIYNADGTLTGHRTVTGDGNDLTFTDIGDFSVEITGGLVVNISGNAGSSGQFLGSDGAGNTEWQTVQMHFRGYHASLAALQSAVPAANDGDYAFVDAGIGNDAEIYIWDTDDDDWVKGNFTPSADASETDKGVVEEGTQSEVNAGTATGGTGAKLFITPAKLLALVATFINQITFGTSPIITPLTASKFVKSGASKELVTVDSATQSEAVAGTDDTKPLTALSSEKKTSVKRSAATVSSGTCTLDCDNKETVRFEDTTARSSAFTVAFSNNTPTELIEYNVPITGTVPITMPSSVVMPSIDGRWNNGTKILTLTGVTASPFCLIFSRIDSSRFELVASYAFHAS